MAIRRICEYLDGNGAPYALLNHHRALTARETAESCRIAAQCMAKTVVVWIDGEMALAVVPANKFLDLQQLQQAVNATTVRLADERDFFGRFEGCQLGAEPPFGNLFGLTTSIDASFGERDFIAFAAGTHTETILMGIGDYKRLAHPQVFRMAFEPHVSECVHV